MQQAPPPQPCSACGKTDAKAVSKSFVYPEGMGAWNSSPASATYVYQCDCGLAFTQTVKVPPPQPPG